MVACRSPAPFNLNVLPCTVTWSGNFTPLISAADAVSAPIARAADQARTITFRTILRVIMIKSPLFVSANVRDKSPPSSRRICCGAALLLLLIASLAGCHRSAADLDWTMGTWHGTRTAANDDQAVPMTVKVDPLANGQIERLQVE